MGEASPGYLTQVLPAAAPNAILKTAEFLQQGHLVVIPTDTVYGVVAHAFNETAVLQLYAAKGRATQKSIPVLLADPEDLPLVVSHLPPTADFYIQQFWPGPLTLVLPKHPNVPTAVSPHETVAVRIPAHNVTRQVIRLAGGAVATTSANRSGEPAATTAESAYHALTGWVTAVLDDGPSPGNLASTVVDCTTTPPTLLRQGPISAQRLGLE